MPPSLPPCVRLRPLVMRPWACWLAQGLELSLWSVPHAGCAFAQFVTQEAAQKCLAAASPEAEVRRVHRDPGTRRGWFGTTCCLPRAARLILPLSVIIKTLDTLCWIPGLRRIVLFNPKISPTRYVVALCLIGEETVICLNLLSVFSF